MSKLLEDLRLEQRHYQGSNLRRYLRVKELADHIEKLEQQLKESNKVIDYYLPTLEERLSCGVYARNYINKYKVEE